MKPIIFSYGGGKQSVAICVLIRKGLLPKPERIVIADTSRECSTTFEYLEKYTRPMMREIGCEMETLSHSYAKQDMYYVDKNLSEKELPLMPVWTKQNGEVAQLMNQCSGTWKRDAVIAWLKEPEQGYGAKNPVIQWIGFSRDEISRCKPSPRRWIKNKWPLIMNYGISLDRQECVQVVLDYGLPEPPKSRCWMCPYQANEEWRDVQTRPEEWAKAIDLDYEIRSRDKQNAVYLHRSGTPLIDADLMDKPDKPQPLFEYSQMECAEGCWI